MTRLPFLWLLSSGFALPKLQDAQCVSEQAQHADCVCWAGFASLGT